MRTRFRDTTTSEEPAPPMAGIDPRRQSHLRSMLAPRVWEVRGGVFLGRKPRASVAQDVGRAVEFEENEHNHEHIEFLFHPDDPVAEWRMNHALAVGIAACWESLLAVRFPGRGFHLVVVDEFGTIRDGDDDAERELGVALVPTVRLWSADLSPAGDELARGFHLDAMRNGRHVLWRRDDLTAVPLPLAGGLSQLRHRHS